MANDAKISELTELVGSNVQGVDLLAIVDTSAGETKRVSITQLKNHVFQTQSEGGDDLSSLSPVNGNIIVGDGSAWVTESGAVARTSLGLGSGDTPTFTGLVLAGLTAGSVLFLSGGKAIVEDNTNFFWDDSNNRLGIGSNVPGAKLHVDQSNVIGAVPVLYLDQADVSEEFIRFVGTSASGVLTQSVVNDADVSSVTRQGFIKVYVQDDGTELTDQAYYIAVNTLA